MGHLKRLIPLWIDEKCLFKLEKHENLSLQFSHFKALIPSWTVDMWDFKSFRDAKLASQMVHLRDFFSRFLTVFIFLMLCNFNSLQVFTD